MCLDFLVNGRGAKTIKGLPEYEIIKKIFHILFLSIWKILFV